MSKQPTQGERLAVIERILEDAFKDGGSVAAIRQDMLRDIKEIRDDVKAIRQDFEAHKLDYHALKNKGIGVIGAVSLMFTAIGVVANAVWDKITGVFG